MQTIKILEHTSRKRKAKPTKPTHQKQLVAQRIEPNNENQFA